MRNRPAWLALIWLLVVGAPLRAADRDLRRTFPVQPGCALRIESYRGQITVEEGDKPEIQVWLHVEIEADTDAEAEKIGANLQIDDGMRGNGVTLTARNPRATGLHFDWEEEKRIELTYRVTVPRKCDVAIRDTTGSVTLGNLAGQMSVQMENGTIFLRRIEGSIVASTDNGDVVISRCSGAVTARVRRGVIRTGPIGGRADLKNTAGNIEVMSARDAIEAKAEAGDITIGFPRGVQGDAKLTTSGGNISVRLDPGADSVIDARSVWGKVICKPQLVVVDGASGTRKLVGRHNAVGPLLMLRASGGDVTIEGGDVWFE